MDLDRTSWHVKLYMLAWLFDRSWFEWLFIPHHEEREEVELDREFRTICVQIDKLYQGWDFKSDAERVAIQEQVKLLATERDELRKKLNMLNRYWVLRTMAQRRINAKKRFDHDKLALCPFFWGVVLAITVYLPLKAIGWMTEKVTALVAAVSTTAAAGLSWPFRWIARHAGEFVRKNQEQIQHGLGKIGTVLGKLAKVAAVLTVGYASYGITNYGTGLAEQWRVEHERTLMAEAEANQYRLTEAPFKEARRLANERAWAERWAEDARIATTTPKDEPSPDRFVYSAHQAKIDEAQRQWWAVQEERRGAVYAARQTMWHIEDDLASYDNWITFCRILAVLCTAVFCLAPVIVFFRRKIWTHAKVQNTVRATSNTWQRLLTWGAETYELATAFAKARKEKVCPYIHFVDDRQKKQQS